MVDNRTMTYYRKGFCVLLLVIHSLNKNKIDVAEHNVELRDISIEIIKNCNEARELLNKSFESNDIDDNTFEELKARIFNISFDLSQYARMKSDELELLAEVENKWY